MQFSRMCLYEKFLSMWYLREHMEIVHEVRLKGKPQSTVSFGSCGKVVSLLTLILSEPIQCPVLLTQAKILFLVFWFSYLKCTSQCSLSDFANQKMLSI